MSDYTMKLGTGSVYDIGSSSTDWIRPSDWLPMPSMLDEEFVGLLAVWDYDSNYVALKGGLAYTVDWGDGYSGSYPTNFVCSHSYNYSDLATESYCSRGYRQAIVRVAPTSSGTFTTIDLQQKHSKIPSANNNFSSPWLDVAFSGSNLVTVAIGGTGILPRKLERAKFDYSAYKIVTAYNLFQNCYSLQEVVGLNTSSSTSFNSIFNSCYMIKTIPMLNSEKVTTFVSAFASCYNLKTIPPLNTQSGSNFNSIFNSCYSLQYIPQINTSKATDMSSMFNMCQTLKSVPTLDTSLNTTCYRMFRYCVNLKTIPLIDTGKSTTFQEMFSACYSLKYIPQLNTQSGSYFHNMFDSCYSLRRIPQLNTWTGSNFSSMFTTCFSLQEIPLIDTGMGTNFSTMFSSCYVLQVIPQLNTQSGSNFTSMFSTCNALVQIPVLNTTNGTTFTTMFNACPALRIGALSGSKNTISYANCQLARNEIVDIFNNLGMAASSGSTTITLTGNHGVVDLSAADLAIASGKNWKVTTA